MAARTLQVIDFNGTKLTPTQRRMLSLLADGLPHTREELHACLNDEQADLSSIQGPISNLRKLMRPHGHDIICELHSHHRPTESLSLAIRGLSLPFSQFNRSHPA
jgi:hypothetical protein